MVLVNDAVRSIVHSIYGAAGEAACKRIATLLGEVDPPGTPPKHRFSETDVVLITYGDSLNSHRRPPIQTLHDFARRYLKACFSAIHFLPFFPYSSDDGFSVTDYLGVDSNLGSWEDVEDVGRDFELMFDYVLNHISAKSPWFENYLEGAEGFQDLAIEVSPQTDLSAVTRPRALPLLTPFKKASGEQVYVWTTFSNDQIDLNYQSLNVLENMIEVLLFYVSKGARMIRMDAVAYLWKQIGTPCIHLPQTHDMVRLFRAILDLVAPNVMIITETNVPHKENIAYFGNGFDEAQLVYNFPLPPLLLYTLHTGDASELSRWARTLSTPSSDTSFFNFTASHDGIGVRPVEGILSSRQIQRLEELATRRGGQVSYKNNPDGSQSAYELNVTYVDAMGGNVEKFLASQAIALAMPGIPAVYIQSLLGSLNWHAGVEKTGRSRSINRQPLDCQAIVDALQDERSFRARVFYPYRRMLEVRRQQAAFHPNAGFEVMHTDQRVFGLRRFTETETIFALTNVSGKTVSVSLESAGSGRQLRDLLSLHVLERASIHLKPYQTCWLVDSR